jgi:hypothetical protein
LQERKSGDLLVPYHPLAELAEMEEVMVAMVMAEVRAVVLVVMVEMWAVGTRVAATVLADIAEAVAVEAMAARDSGVEVNAPLAPGYENSRHEGDAPTQSIWPARCDRPTAAHNPVIACALRDGPFTSCARRTHRIK